MKYRKFTVIPATYGTPIKCFYKLNVALEYSKMLTCVTHIRFKDEPFLIRDINAPKRILPHGWKCISDNFALYPLKNIKKVLVSNETT